VWGLLVTVVLRRPLSACDDRLLTEVELR
jgi:hypothetical protein